MTFYTTTFMIFRKASILFYLMLSYHSFASEQVAKDLNPLPSTHQGIVLKSDHSKMDGKTGLFEYCGHALLTQPGLRISAKCLTGKKREDGSYEFISASGTPAQLVQVNTEKKESLVVKADNIIYKIPNQFFDISGKAELKIENKKTQDSLQIKAKRIELNNRLPQNREIRASGKPLEIELMKSGQMDLRAKSKKLFFSTGTANLKLSEDVIANLELGEISAGVFNYNSETKISSFEKSNDQQVEIIQTKKQPK